MRSLIAFSSVLVLAAAACDENKPGPEPARSAAAVSTATQTPADKLDAVSRADFNRLAADLDLPIFWLADTNKSGTIEPDELAVLWGIGDRPVTWIEGGRFSRAFLDAYQKIVKAKKDGLAAGGDAAEKKRRAAVVAELEQTRESVIRSDLRSASAEDKALVGHVIAAAAVIERLYEKQLGVYGEDKAIAADDTASKMLFFRNHGPYCEQPKTEKDPDCNALASKPPKVSGLYPASVQKDPKFCEALEARKDGSALLAPFGVVVEDGSALKYAPYSVAYKEDMEQVSHELSAAAAAITSDSEAALKAYLLADAQAFLDDKWEPADEAWAKMNATNSKWYLRIAPDEVYDDTCSHKAGFQVSFARINQESLTWQKKLDPLKTEMEETLAKLAGPPYEAHPVTFHLPDFIDIVLNAGDARSASGATVGESLPNWGPVANDGRGRTVAMTNFDNDPDSTAAFKDRVESVYCKSAMDGFDYAPSLSTMSTVLHEATHNLGPAHEYKVKGKTDEQVFGGPLASTFEELKAQTGALYFAEWLVDKGQIDKKTAEASREREIAWAFGHIADGMYTADHKPKPYSHLSAIQVGWLLKAGALTWSPDEAAANGKDKGCFAFQKEKFSPAVIELAKVVLGIKGRGDKDGAVKLREEFVDKTDDFSKIRDIIKDRWLRAPRSTFVYAIDL